MNPLNPIDIIKITTLISKPNKTILLVYDYYHLMLVFVQYIILCNIGHSIDIYNFL